MPSSEYDTSVTELSLVVVFQLGLCILLLAQIADGTQGYETVLSSVGYLVGGVTAVGALLTLIVRRRVGFENS